MTRIGCPEREAKVKRGGSDLQICQRDHSALLPRLSIDPRRQLPDLLREWLYRNHRVNFVDIGAPVSCALHRICAPNTMLQFGHADCGDHDVVKARRCADCGEHLADWLHPALGRDQNARIENQSQTEVSSGSLCASIAACTSAAKSA